MATSFLSPASKAKREADLEQMRERWGRKPPKVKPPDRRKPSSVKGKARWTARQRAKFKNQAGPRLWARSQLTLIIAGLKQGESIWLESDSKKVHSAARTAMRKVTTRTVMKRGVMGVNVTAGALRPKKKIR